MSIAEHTVRHAVDWVRRGQTDAGEWAHVAKRCSTYSGALHA